MSRKLNNQRDIDKAKPGRYSLGNNLCINVTKPGKGSWYISVMFQGKRKAYGLGPYPLLTLQEARERVHKALYAFKVEKRNPFINPYVKTEGMPLFKDAAKATYEKKKPSWSANSARNWWAKIENHALPVIGDIPVDAVSVQHLANILLPIWEKNHVTAQKVKQHIGQVLASAIANEHISENLAESSALAEALPDVKHETKHQRAMHYTKAPAALEAIRKCEGNPAAKLAVQLMTFTGCRLQEAMGARWSEFDLDNEVWSIGRERMKMSSDHRIPLSDDAVAVVREARKLGRSKFVFPSAKKPGVHISREACRNVLKKAGIFEETCHHGFRSCMGTFATERGYDPVLVELCLSHKEGTKTKRAYIRTDRLEDRRPIMQTWADYLTI